LSVLQASGAKPWGLPPLQLTRGVDTLHAAGATL
jgi:hypothetical protein